MKTAFEAQVVKSIAAIRNGEAQRARRPQNRMDFRQPGNQIWYMLRDVRGHHIVKFLVVGDAILKSIGSPNSADMYNFLNVDRWLIGVFSLQGDCVGMINVKDAALRR